MSDLATKRTYLSELMTEMLHATPASQSWPTYRTTHDLAQLLGQSMRTARRILNEVFPGRESPDDWRLGASEWECVLVHLATSDNRRYGRRRNRSPKSKEVAQ